MTLPPAPQHCRDIYYSISSFPPPHTFFSKCIWFDFKALISPTLYLAKYIPLQYLKQRRQTCRSIPVSWPQTGLFLPIWKMRACIVAYHATIVDIGSWKIWTCVLRTAEIVFYLYKCIFNLFVIITTTCILYFIKFYV